MRYHVLRPTTPIDPRLMTFKSVEDLDAQISPALYLDGKLMASSSMRVEVPFVARDEADVVRYVRDRMPDAVPMPVPIRIGTAESFLLGFVADPAKRIDPEGDIPFVLFVHARADNGGDTFRLKKDRHKVYNRSLWRLPPICPDISKTVAVEVRHPDFEVPFYTSAEIGVGPDGTHHVLWMDLLGKELSITFRDDDVKLTKD